MRVKLELADCVRDVETSSKLFGERRSQGLQQPSPVFRPGRPAHRPYAAALAAQIDDYPSPFSQLNIFNRQRGEFLPGAERNRREER